MGSIVKEFRQAFGLTANQLAAQLGIDRQTIYNWESGATTPPPYLALALEKIKADITQQAGSPQENII